MLRRICAGWSRGGLRPSCEVLNAHDTQQQNCAVLGSHRVAVAFETWESKENNDYFLNNDNLCSVTMLKPDHSVTHLCMFFLVTDQINHMPESDISSANVLAGQREGQAFKLEKSSSSFVRMHFIWDYSPSY